MSERGRIEIDAQDYFNDQKKTLAFTDRRPSIRKASDLVGPGISGAAVRIVDFNDPLPTFNGYFSAEAGATNSPDSTLPPPQREAFIGYVVADTDLGGEQVFTGLSTGSEFKRLFLRAPADATAITWQPWQRAHRIPPTAGEQSVSQTSVGVGSTTALRAPSIDGVAFRNTYFSSFDSNDTFIRILEQGIYSGFVEIRATGTSTLTGIVSIPDHLYGTKLLGFIGPASGVRVSFIITNTSPTPVDITIEASHSAASAQFVRWDVMQITRHGDAI